MSCCCCCCSESAASKPEICGTLTTLHSKQEGLSLDRECSNPPPSSHLIIHSSLTLLEQEMHSLIWRRTGLLLVPVIKVDSAREIAFACLYKDLIYVNRVNRTAQRSSLLYCSLVGSNKLYRAMRNAHKVTQIA